VSVLQWLEKTLDVIQWITFRIRDRGYFCSTSAVLPYNLSKLPHLLLSLLLFLPFNFPFRLEVL